MDEYCIFVVIFAPVHISCYLAQLFTYFVQVSSVKQKFPGLLISSHLRSSDLRFKTGFRKIMHIPRACLQQQCDTAAPNTQTSFVGRLFSYYSLIKGLYTSHVTSLACLCPCHLLSAAFIRVESHAKFILLFMWQKVA